MIEFQKVSIKYITDYYSLYNLNFKISKNCTLVGEKTSGANFVLRLLAQIDKTYQGEIFIEGKNLKQIKAKDLDLAYVTVQPVLFKQKSVLRNLIYPLVIRKTKKDEAKNIVKQFLSSIDLKILFDLKDFNLETFLKTKAKKLSEIQRKLLCFIRAIIRKPGILLLENLTEGLNQKQVEIVKNILNNISSLIISVDNKNVFGFEEIKFENGSVVK